MFNYQLKKKRQYTLLKELDLKGTLHVLRHGFKFYGKLFRMAYFRPAHGLTPVLQERYEANRLTVTRTAAIVRTFTSCVRAGVGGRHRARGL